VAGSAIEYEKMLHSICVNDGKLLGSEMIGKMFTPQLRVASQKAFYDRSGKTRMSSGLGPSTRLNYGLGG